MSGVPCSHDRGSRLDEKSDMWTCVMCGSQDIAPMVEVAPSATAAHGARSWRLANGQVWTSVPYVTGTHTLRPVAPASYVDENGAGHGNVPEFMRLVRLEETPENVALVRGMLRDALRGMGVRMVEDA